MKNKLSKKETKEKINEIFLKNPSTKEIKKAKRLAMSKNIKLKDLKKLFCKKCFILFNSKNSETRINNSFKIIKCKNCGYISRYKIK